MSILLEKRLRLMIYRGQGVLHEETFQSFAVYCYRTLHLSASFCSKDDECYMAVAIE